MIYKLDHYYATNHCDYCGLVEMNKELTDVLGIVAALQFLLEDIIAPEKVLLPDMDCLVDILVTHYAATNVRERFESSLLSMYVPASQWELYNIISMDDCTIVQIDLQKARELCSFPEKREYVLENYLPTGDGYEDIVSRLRASKVSA